MRGEVTQPAEGAVPIALGLARSAWPLWQTESEPPAGPWADLSLLLAVALLRVVRWVAFRPQGVAGLLADVFGQVLAALGTG